jgi:hypothetical protein
MVRISTADLTFSALATAILTSCDSGSPFHDSISHL